MNDSILTSIKKLLGIQEDYIHFDTDIIMHINSIFLTLSQIGVGPSEGFSIEDKLDEWTDFIPDGMLLNTIKTYMYLKVKLVFDPPLSSAAMESMKNMINEYEWRIHIAVDPGEGEN